MRDLWGTSKGPLLLAGVPINREGSADKIKEAPEGPHLRMPGLREAIPSGEAAKGTP